MTALGDAPLILVGYGRGWLRMMRRIAADRPVLIIEEPAAAHARCARAQLATDWPECDLYELEYRRPMAADLFHLWHPELRASAVIPIDDSGVVFAARLAERLGLPNAGPVPAATLQDKWRLRQVADAAGIAGPQWRLARRAQDAAVLADRLGSAVVVKPSARAGASGVEIVDDPAGLAAAWARTTAPAATPVYGVPAAETYLVERRMTGRQFNVNLLVRDGQVLFDNVTRTVVATGANPVPLTEIVTPDLPAELTADLVANARRLVEAVGLRTGFIHSEWIVEDGTVRLIECGGRLPGSMITVLISYAYPVDLVGAYLAVMSGRPLPAPLPRQPRQAAVMRTKQVPPGRVLRVSGVEAARALDGVADIMVLVGEGGTVRELHSLPDAPAWATGVGPGTAEALAAADRALASIEIVTEPVEHDPVEQEQPEQEPVRQPS